jgi:hypothetical protein
MPALGHHFSSGAKMTGLLRNQATGTSRSCRRGALVFLFAGLLAHPAAAGLILGQYDWDTANTNWQTDHGFAELQRIPTNGHPNGWLEFVLPATTNSDYDAPNQWDIAKVDASSLFAGGWRTNMWIEFDFWSTNTTPPAVQVRWQSSLTNYVWAYNVSPLAGGGWNTLRAPLANWDDWNTLGGGSLEQYLDDLATIDWVGVYIHRTGLGAETYGLDDFRLMVPEPGQLLMLGTTLAVSWLSLRRQRKR